MLGISMFKEKKLIVILDPLSNSKLKEELIEKGEAFISSDNVLLLVEQSKILKIDKLLKYLEKNGKVQEFELLTGVKLKNWVKKEIEVEKRYEKLNFGEQDKISKSVRLKPDGYCPTLRAGTGSDKGSYQAVRPIHFKEPRVITPREAARLQGFPDWFVFHETKWHSFRQIGNSVSPIVAEAILKTIKDSLANCNTR
jgi:site-specific DNA-cytosine methylase